jgi:hypothetical protein
MAHVVNRTTKQFLQSVNTTDFPTAQWIINPNLSAVTGFESKYWIITGDVVTLMDAAARASVDAAILSAARDATANQLDGVENVLRAFMLTLLDELNAHATKINAILTAIDGAGTFSAMKTSIAAITDYPSRTGTQIKTTVRSKLGS